TPRGPCLDSATEWFPGPLVLQAGREPRIDPEFASLMPAQTPEQAEQLEALLLADGVCREPLTLWAGHDIVLDGHHRLTLCRKHGIPYRTGRSGPAGPQGRHRLDPRQPARPAQPHARADQLPARQAVQLGQAAARRQPPEWNGECAK